jgi:mevalonate kinase
MDPINSRIFSSKILLFGEYLVLQGGHSLSFPFKSFTLKRSLDYFPKNKYFFQKIVEYIAQNERLRNRITPAFEEQVNKGLHFESNIPVGYGLGSSGALVAAIYEDFFIDKSIDIAELKTDLAELESFFHTKSSGIDPLTSYLDKGILSSQDKIEVLNDLELGKFTLYDSGKKRSAKDAIHHFNELKQDNHFNIDLARLTEISNKMISKYLLSEDIQSEMFDYSQQQFITFKDFIPENVAQEWQKGLNTGEFYMKLCGAGMGGMYLKFNVMP